MTETAGNEWTDQFTEDWNAALDLVSSLMIEGAHAAKQKTA